MSICSLCIHIDACRAWVRHGKALYEDFEYSVDNCPQFTNNYDIVEVVRCKDCKYYTPYCRVCNHPKLWTTEEAELDVTDNDFCSYAERTTT